MYISEEIRNEQWVDKRLGKEGEERRRKKRRE